ncbi:MAG TPA: tetratricopeptide repeat protein [Saprospiraceae bacterium]|nr:tetratricopeptide repeat protein [Saprospiraceae bacterium]
MLNFYQLKNHFFLLLLFFGYACRQEKNQHLGNTDFPPATFVGAESCKSCHQKAYQDWKGSDHDLSMQVADSTTVLGDFDNISFTTKGIKYHFFKKDGKYYVNTIGEGGVYKNYNIVFTFGVKPLQQYLIKFPAYERALQIDNFYNPSRINLALLKYQEGELKAAENLYLKVIEQEPEYSYPYYMLGLLYNENNASEKSLKYLSQACEKQPFISRAFYNYGLKLQEQGAYQKSIVLIDRALKNDPFNENLLYIKLLAQLKTNQKKAAKSTCTILIKIAPANTRYQEILQSLN